MRGVTMRRRTISITDIDRKRLEDLIAAARPRPDAREGSLNALQGELRRARIVPLSRMPEDVITMNSVVRLRDLDSGETETYTLVFPSDADVSLQRISVLAPVGTAILGYREGDVIEWQVPAGLRRLEVVEVVHQPGRVEAHPV